MFCMATCYTKICGTWDVFVCPANYIRSNIAISHFILKYVKDETQQYCFTKYIDNIIWNISRNIIEETIISQGGVCVTAIDYLVQFSLTDVIL